LESNSLLNLKRDFEKRLVFNEKRLLFDKNRSVFIENRFLFNAERNPRD